MYCTHYYVFNNVKDSHQSQTFDLKAVLVFSVVRSCGGLVVGMAGVLLF
jgi:hypothetical protein